MATPLDILNQVCAEKGASAEIKQYLAKTMACESGGRNVQCSTSSAAGYYQITDDTWAGIVKRHPDLRGANRNDPHAQTLAALYLTQENAASLKKAGHEVNDGNLYLAHFLGSTGANKLLSASPGASLESIGFGKIIGPNKSIKLEYDDEKGVHHIKHIKDFTAGDLRAWATKKMGGKIRYDLLDRQIQGDVLPWDDDNEPEKYRFTAGGSFSEQLILAFVGLLFKAFLGGDDKAAPAQVAAADQTTVAPPAGLPQQRAAAAAPTVRRPSTTQLA